jgi:hypothetical protein
MKGINSINEPFEQIKVKHCMNNKEIKSKKVPEGSYYTV